MNDREAGDVAIEIGSIEADRNLTGKKENYIISMAIYTYGGETTQKQSIDFYKGKETELGGYHITVKDLFFSENRFPEMDRYSIPGNQA